MMVKVMMTIKLRWIPVCITKQHSLSLIVPLNKYRSWGRKEKEDADDDDDDDDDDPQ